MKYLEWDMRVKAGITENSDEGNSSEFFGYFAGAYEYFLGKIILQ